MLHRSVVYSDQVATERSSVAETLAQLQDAGVAWLDLVDPTPQELHEIKTAFKLHDLAVRDVIQGRPRPKIKEFGTTQFIVLRPSSPVICSRQNSVVSQSGRGSTSLM